MAAHAPALAKLKRPQLHRAVPRPRLFALLDEAVAARPIVWVCAPPGSGKSTLVAGWLEARKRRHLWYQVDAGDAEPATFAHYMRLAALPLTRKRAPAALFPPQPQQELGSFARAFFRDLFALLPHGAVLVLDNFHEARTRSKQRAALAQALEEMPEGCNLIVVSRSEPPPEFARLAAAQRIARIDAAALRCNADEAAAILGQAGPDSPALQRLRQLADGWLAALVLLREHLSRSDAGVDVSGALGAGRDAVFAYFAGEIFMRASAAERRLMMLTSIAPSVTEAEAVALCGDPAAPRLLESLYRRHLFVDRRQGETATYHYHALFREFLQREASRRLGADERRASAAHAARLLAERGLVHDALALARDAEQWATMLELILANACDWARQGRAQMLSDWIDALPAALRDAHAWLAYWQGRAWIFVAPQRGRPLLERARERFRASDDVRGQALCLATLVTGCYHEWADFRPLDQWLPELDSLFGNDAALPAAIDRECELRARAAYLIALLLRRPDLHALARCAVRLDALIDAETDADMRVTAASVLFNYYNWVRNDGAADRLVSRTEPALASNDVGPLTQVWWRTHVSFWHYLNGRYEASAAIAAAAHALAERYGLEAYLFEIDHARAEALISQRDFAAAKSLVDAIERRLAPTRRMDRAYFHNLRSTLRQRLGQAAAAVHDAELALVLARETGLPPLQMPTFIARVAQARAGTGDLVGGMRALDEAMALAGSDDERRSFAQLRALMQVEQDIADGADERACARLADTLATYRARGRHEFLRNRPDGAARLAAYALDHGIEVDYVRVLIERNQLPAPRDAGPGWPFRLRVHALGGFALVRDGQPLRFSGKAQQRPLDLLKLLVASGGQEIDSQSLTDALWPDADGAAAKTSFDSTLFRLRKLLDVDDVLVLAGGRLSLARGLAWSDVAALERAIEQAALGRDADIGAVQAAAQRLLRAYGGPLLGSEEAAWVLRPRDVLRARFIGALTRLGERLERAGAWDGASALYRRGLEADNLAESLHRGLIRTLAAAGQQAEALNAFRRCRDLLSVVLGVRPSAETEGLQREILAGRLGPPT